MSSLHRPQYLLVREAVKMAFASILSDFEPIRITAYVTELCCSLLGSGLDKQVLTSIGGSLSHVLEYF